MTEPADRARLRDIIAGIVKRMRSDGPRYKSHDLGFVDSVGVSTVEDWADELEAALSVPSTPQACPICGKTYAWHSGRDIEVCCDKAYAMQPPETEEAVPVQPQAELTEGEVIVLREGLRRLDCGHHYCRYCSAKSPSWEHSRSCLYEDSVRVVDEGRKILDRIQAALHVRSTSHKEE